MPQYTILLVFGYDHESTGYINKLYSNGFINVDTIEQINEIVNKFFNDGEITVYDNGTNLLNVNTETKLKLVEQISSDTNNKKTYYFNKDASLNLNNVNYKRTDHYFGDGWHSGQYGYALRILNYNNLILPSNCITCNKVCSEGITLCFRCN